MRFTTLDAICRELGCQPGDILVHVSDEVETSRAEAEADGEPEMNR